MCGTGGCVWAAAVGGGIFCVWVLGPAISPASEAEAAGGSALPKFIGISLAAPDCGNARPGDIDKDDD